MLSIIGDLLVWALGLFGFGKPDPFKQGQDLGKAQAGQANAEGELRDIAKADAARRAVSDAPAAILSDPDNAGPAKR